MKLFKLLLLLPVFGYSQLTESVVCLPPDSLGANIIRCDSVELKGFVKGDLKVEVYTMLGEKVMEKEV